MKKEQMQMFLILAVTCITLQACKKIDKVEISAPETSQAETETETETETPEESREGMVRSYLTGLWVDEAIGISRPIAVMLSNEKVACPQSGINAADIVYEIPVEGGTNRFMGIFENYADLKKIGSVRSARTYYVYFAKEFEAILVHYGQSKFAEPYIATANCDNLNGVEGIGATVYYRTSDRKAPHNAYASAEGILKGIEKKGYSMDYPSNYEGHFQFAKEENSVNLTNGQAAAKLTLGYVINKPWFEYNKEDGLYYRFQYGAAQIDTEDQKQITCKNIIIQYISNTYYANTEYLDIDLQSGGQGKYITNGEIIDITWEKKTEWGITKYYDASGAEIELNPGKTWVCLVPVSRLEYLEISGE